jgi:hypothetical protein
LNQREIELAISELRNQMIKVNSDFAMLSARFSGIIEQLNNLQSSVNKGMEENKGILQGIQEALMGKLGDRKEKGLVAEHEEMLSNQVEILAFHRRIKKWYWMIIGGSTAVGAGLGLFMDWAKEKVLGKHP